MRHRSPQNLGSALGAQSCQLRRPSANLWRPFEGPDEHHWSKGTSQLDRLVHRRGVGRLESAASKDAGRSAPLFEPRYRDGFDFTSGVPVSSASKLTGRHSTCRRSAVRSLGAATPIRSGAACAANVSKSSSFSFHAIGRPQRIKFRCWILRDKNRPNSPKTCRKPKDFQPLTSAAQTTKKVNHEMAPERFA
jgi:hypothetical protein